MLSRVQVFATPRTLANQTPLAMEFSSQEYWSGLPFLSPGDLPIPGIKSGSPALQADSLLSEPQGKPVHTHTHTHTHTHVYIDDKMTRYIDDTCLYTHTRLLPTTS